MSNFFFFFKLNTWDFLETPPTFPNLFIFKFPMKNELSNSRNERRSISKWVLRPSSGNSVFAGAVLFLH